MSKNLELLEDLLKSKNINYKKPELIVIENYKGLKEDDADSLKEFIKSGEGVTEIGQLGMKWDGIESKLFVLSL